MRKSLAAASVSILIFSTALRAQTDLPATQPVVTAQETQGTPDQRADQLLAELTLLEKIELLSGNSDGFSTRPIPRLGIGRFFMSDGPNGVRNGPGTPTPPGCAFPCGAALAATWDPDMAAAYGTAMGLEDRARGSNFQLGPGLNICRVPVNGRNFEYFGEDPNLASIIAVNWVKNCSAQGSVPTIKHFAGNNQETDRNSVDAQIDERTLHEIYLPAFKKAATEGGIVAVMCSYNRLNDSYASNNDWLLNQTLKKEWGFVGLVMSDWGASHSVSDLAKGLDLEMPNGRNLSQQNVTAALEDGTLKPSDIDNAVHRILRTEAAQGWFDTGWVQKDPKLPLDSDASAKTALEVAEASVVLLKNDSAILPLDRSKVKTILVVGPNAAAAPGTIPINIGGGGSGAVTPSPNRFAEADYLNGITKAAGDGVKVIYLPTPTDSDDEYNVMALAHTTDGQPGLTLNVQVTGTGDAVAIEPSVQSSINVTWQPGQLPFGVPAGRDATFTWSGVLSSPTQTDIEVRVGGSPVITIDNRVVADGTILKLQPNQAVPVTIEEHALANPRGRGRGGRGRGRGGANANMVRVAFIPPLIPNLSDAPSADAAIVCVGLNRIVEQEGRDRPFDLPDVQQYLISKVAAANPHTIVINNSGAGVGMTDWIDSTASVLQAWYLGQEGGIAIGKILFGDVNPSGRLVSTFDRKFEDNPAYPYYPGKIPDGGSYRVEPYTEGIFYGYRGYDKAGKDPLFPFGFGLSYTTFDISNPKISQSGSDIKVSVDIKNTGSRAGAEVVEIYAGEENAPLPRPLRELKGFAKVMLEPGATKPIEISIPRDSLAYWSPATKKWVVDPRHTFNFEIGESEREIKFKLPLQIQ